jgi:hypothetical protein
MTLRHTPSVINFLDIDECEDKEAYSCYGICQNFPGSFHCQCPEGKYGNSSIKGGCITIKNSFSGYYSSICATYYLRDQTFLTSLAEQIIS